MHRLSNNKLQTGSFLSGNNPVFLMFTCYLKVLFLFALPGCSLFKEEENKDVIRLERAKASVDVNPFFKVEFIEIHASYPLNIKKVRSSEKSFLYLGDDSDPATLLIFDLKSKTWADEINFRELNISPIDFAVHYPIIYVLGSDDKIFFYNLQSRTIEKEIKLNQEKYSEIEVFNNQYLILKKDNLVSVDPDSKILYRVKICELFSGKILREFDPYNFQPGSNVIITNSQAFLKQRNEIFYIKPFCDTVFRFYAEQKTFGFYKFIAFHNPVNYQKYAHIKSDLEKYKAIEKTKEFETGIFLFSENEQFRIFQYLSNGKPAFYYLNKKYKTNFCTYVMNHAAGTNLPFPEWLTPETLITVLNENTLIKHDFRPANPSLLDIKRKITYEGKNYLVLYYPAHI